jgi:hypothetical protein
MTQERPPRPRLVPREDADETPTHASHANGNGHSPEMPTHPPGGLADLPGHRLMEDTAREIGLLHGKVDTLITDARLLPSIRADVKLGLAIGYEALAMGHEGRAAIDRLESGQQEILSLLRANQNGQRAAQMNSTKALQRAAASDEKSTKAAAEAAKAHEVAKRAEREAKAARDTSARASQSDIVLQQAGARLLDMTVETTVDRERGEARIELDERKANSLARRKVVAGAVGLVVFILTVLGVAFRDRLLGTSHQDHRPPSGLERTSP